MDDARPRLTDEIWGRLAEALKGLKSRAGAPPKQSDRDLIEAVLHPARTDEPWRDLPKRFGERDAVYRRFRRREEAARWRKLFERLPADLHEVRAPFLDGSVIRAHPRRRGTPTKRAGVRRPWAQPGRARGRDPRGSGRRADGRRRRPDAGAGGRRADVPGADRRRARGVSGRRGGRGRGYDSDAIRADLKERGIEPVKPPPACREEEIRYDEKAYRRRNEVERPCNELKRFRRVATRYDELDLSFLAVIHPTAALVMIR
jgi:transposase